MIPSAVCVPTVVLQTKFSLSSKFLRYLGSMQKTSTQALSTSRKHTTGLLVKSGVFRENGVDDRLLLAIKSLYPCSEVFDLVGRGKPEPFTVGLVLRQAGTDPVGEWSPPLKPKKGTFFHHDFVEFGKIIRDIRTFCCLLFYHRSVVKYSLLHLSYSSEPVMRLDCQILLKSPLVTHLLDPPLATRLCSVTIPFLSL